MKSKLAILAAGSVFSMTTLAQAEFGRQGNVAFSADRLSGFYIHDQGGFTGNVLALGASASRFSAYTTARFGVDGVVVDHLTIGGNLALWSLGGDADGFGFLIYPRVGYVINFGQSFGFWPRGGLTFTSWDGGAWWREDSEMALSFEANFFGVATSNFGFTFGPSLDLGVAGDGPMARSFGIIAGGVFGWL
jgi:hypothetical protein